jgi:hypothetical protein
MSLVVRKEDVKGGQRRRSTGLETTADRFGVRL